MSDSAFSEVFCRWAVAPELYLCEEAMNVAKFSLLDTLACMYLGTRMPQPKAVEMALEMDRNIGDVMSVGGGNGHTLTGAALLNGTRVHAMDFDDYELSGSSHASGPIFSALFALSAVKQLSIKQLCEAWVVGHEAIVQMGQALGYGHYDKGWHSTLTLGPVGVAAAVSRALSLDPLQMANAMALASSSSSGSLRQTGSDTKAIHEGLAAQAGLRAAFLASSGASSNKDIWDIPSGFVALYGTKDSPGFNEVIKQAKLGYGVRLYPVVRKLWPSCAYTQRAIMLAEHLSSQIDKCETIVSITYRMPRPFYQVARFDLPENDAQARFSIPYCLAAGILTGHVVPQDFEETAFFDETRRKLASIVKLDLYELPQGHSGDIGVSTPERLVVQLSNGHQIESEALSVPGGADLPMTELQLLQKMKDSGLKVELAKAFLKLDMDKTFYETSLFQFALFGPNTI